MSDIPHLIRATARRVLGADSPILNDVVEAALLEVTTAVREKLVTTDLRTFARQVTQVAATRGYARERRTAVSATGRRSTVDDCWNLIYARESARLAAAEKQLAEIRAKAPQRGKELVLHSRRSLVAA